LFVALAYLVTVEKQEEQERGGSRMLSEKLLLISERVLFMAAGLIAVVLAIASTVISSF
jgi:hypothetical protein